MINLEFFNKLAKKEKMLMAAAAIIVTMVIIDRLVINPISEKFKRVNSDIKLSEKKLSLDLRNINNKNMIESEYKRYRNYVKRSYASDEEDVANILGEIEGLARTSSVRLVDIKPQAPRQADLYKEYAIDVEIEGDMEQVTTFLYNLNNSAQLLRVTKLRLGLKDKETSLVKASVLVTKISM
jgi:Tfp pilus assembly protein PilO